MKSQDDEGVDLKQMKIWVTAWSTIQANSTTMVDMTDHAMEKKRLPWKRSSAKQVLLVAIHTTYYINIALLVTNMQIHTMIVELHGICHQQVTRENMNLFRGFNDDAQQSSRYDITLLVRSITICTYTYEI